MVRLHYFLLAPWIVLTQPSEVFLGSGGLLTLIVITVGVSGNLARVRSGSTVASISLVVLLILGKARTDILRLPAPDTAIFLLQFVLIIFFMEASSVILSFGKAASQLSGRSGDMSQVMRQELEVWVRGQLGRQATLIVGALALSLLLIVLGGLTSVSITQILFSGSLVLVVIGILLLLITQRRESESQRGPR